MRVIVFYKACVWALCLVGIIQSANAQTVLLDSLALDTAKVYTSLEEALKNPDKVIKLDLRRKHLKQLPPDIFKLVNLQYLDISKNQLTELPVQIGQLKQLQYLNISKNNITVLPPAVGELTHLYSLNIGQNNIYALPVEIGKLEKLKYFDAWNNNLSVFPAELANLKQLKIFDLRSILISEREQKRIQALLPATKIFFAATCSCQN